MRTPLSSGLRRIGRRAFLLALPAALTGLAGCWRGSRRAVVGFAQMDSGGAWRVAETESMRRAAAEQADRYELVVTDAQDQTAKQVADVEDLIARRAIAVFIAPRDYEGLEPVFDAARHARIPIFLIDRAAEGEPGRDYVAFLGSDFVAQGQRAGEWLASATGGSAGVVELTGTPGSSVARDRALGFRRATAQHPSLRLI